MVQQEKYFEDEIEIIVDEDNIYSHSNTYEDKKHNISVFP